MKHKAVFIDKDGTLIPDIPYNVDPALITLSPGAGESLRRIQDNGFLLVVVSNQAGIARGLFEETALRRVKARLEHLLAEHGVSLDGFYYCPHLPEGIVPGYTRECRCRKPEPGMLLTAARDLNLDLSASWMVGDILTDSEAGNRAGCRTVLIKRAGEPLIDVTAANVPDFIVSGWQMVSELIV